MPKIAIIRGRVWKFGKNVSTSDITPGELFGHVRRPPEEIVFAALRPDWKDQVKPGDCIVAEENFGMGSQRIQANEAMKTLKIGCIVADSISRTYFRGAISLGFPVFPCPGVSQIFEEGDEIELDIYTGLVKNLTRGKSLYGKTFDPMILEILEAGGMLPKIVKMEKEAA